MELAGSTVRESVDAPSLNVLKGWRQCGKASSSASPKSFRRAQCAMGV